MPHNNFWQLWVVISTYVEDFTTVLRSCADAAGLSRASSFRFDFCIGGMHDARRVYERTKRKIAGGCTTSLVRTKREIARGMYIVWRVYEQDKRLLNATAAKYVLESGCCGIQKRVRVGWACGKVAACQCSCWRPASVWCEENKMQCAMCVSGNPWTGGMMLASAQPASLMWGECVCENGDSTWMRMRNWRVGMPIHGRNGWMLNSARPVGCCRISVKASKSRI